MYMKFKYWKSSEKSKAIRKGTSYFVNGGDYEDQILVFMEEKNDLYGFLTIPLQKNLWVPKEKFDFALQEVIIEFVEHLPNHVIEVTDAKFQENLSELRSTP